MILGLIAKAILSSKEHRMVLSEIYEWIQANYGYFRSRGPGWRNSIRHNLSLNDCFIKVGKMQWKPIICTADFNKYANSFPYFVGRSSNGKGHYWGIHPANIEDFRRGDFRRRRAQRKVRRALGLSCPGDGDDSDSPPISPPPQISPIQTNGIPLLPLRSTGNSTGGKCLLPPTPTVDIFTAWLNSLASSRILPANVPIHPSQLPIPPHLPNIQPPRTDQEVEECSRRSPQSRPASSAGSFSVASLLGA